MLYIGCLFSLQVQLQNILMSKYVEYFQAEVSSWQRKLMVADLVISSWMSVQRTWAHLNSIFTNSHDIRCQLANDAERFQGIHNDFQVTQMNSLVVTIPSYHYVALWPSVCATTLNVPSPGLDGRGSAEQ